MVTEKIDLMQLGPAGRAIIKETCTRMGWCWDIQGIWLVVNVPANDLFMFQWWFDDFM